MKKFEALVAVLDSIRKEGCQLGYNKLYAVNEKDQETVWQARSRAYIHLYLKVMFGIRDFLQRETHICDGGIDGGIDGYYIDQENKRVLLIQSKFRKSEDNFENKTMTLDEMLKMDIRRVLTGEENNSEGLAYNGKVRSFQRALGEIPNIPIYEKRVVLLANVSTKYSSDMLSRVCDGYPVEIFDHQHAYDDILFPVISGSLFKAKEISIKLDLSNKSAGAKIYYNLCVDGFNCAITLVFVPIIEIAKFMSEYQNSILQYNPRSYLEFAGAPVNKAIRDTAISPDRNEFALLNNGITIICKRSSVTEESGLKNKPVLFLTSPQIINGGQTAYTLSRLYDELPAEDRENKLGGKEVLVKTMALYPIEDMPNEEEARLKMIERISQATNNQTAVTVADRTSTDNIRIHTQMEIYRRHGVLIENKRGEFSEGLRAGYIRKGDIVDRSLFQRLYFVANGDLNKSVRRKVLKGELPSDAAVNQIGMDRFFVALELWQTFSELDPSVTSYKERMPQIFAAMSLFGPNKDLGRSDTFWIAQKILDNWKAFRSSQRRARKEAQKSRYAARAEEDTAQSVPDELHDRMTRVSMADQIILYFRAVTAQSADF